MSRTDSRTWTDGSGSWSYGSHSSYTDYSGQWTDTGYTETGWGSRAATGETFTVPLRDLVRRVDGSFVSPPAHGGAPELALADLPRLSLVDCEGLQPGSPEALPPTPDLHADVISLGEDEDVVVPAVGYDAVAGVWRDEGGRFLKDMRRCTIAEHETRQADYLRRHHPGMSVDEVLCDAADGRLNRWLRQQSPPPARSASIRSSAVPGDPQPNGGVYHLRRLRPEQPLGLRYRREGGRVLITGATPGSPADVAGVRAGGELRALGGRRVTADSIAAAAAACEGRSVVVVVLDEGADVIAERLRAAKPESAEYDAAATDLLARALRDELAYSTDKACSEWLAAQDSGDGPRPPRKADRSAHVPHVPSGSMPLPPQPAGTKLVPPSAAPHHRCPVSVARRSTVGAAAGGGGRMLSAGVRTAPPQGGRRRLDPARAAPPVRLGDRPNPSASSRGPPRLHLAAPPAISSRPAGNFAVS
eukprot:TRINITY_DN47733_c0_g1_i1.p1 TRINITY_DN47733_c0_g1~~TRINITY_DN47733_c0_g1_i1.p1  ORF type:complete len:474 (+),score=86.32 TRINITY_DN47733_c0_g1_i1:53-1474(+)